MIDDRTSAGGGASKLAAFPPPTRWRKRTRGAWVREAASTELVLHAENPQGRVPAPAAGQHTGPDGAGWTDPLYGGHQSVVCTTCDATCIAGERRDRASRPVSRAITRALRVGNSRRPATARKRRQARPGIPALWMCWTGCDAFFGRAPRYRSPVSDPGYSCSSSRRTGQVWF